ncbi:MAG: hypothetical protein A2070_13870 [Bdellovibrionales bacterium GWC1_52_8]|nr:MAG: hypothetical protein A2Z97_08075 [Bdellovibrionales bacterium GWB1_52_6]OFZ37107.1 MAG: hypothetical protein A2070_13870 [Bdellovibrionales bacterium GWC1_52_8]
MSPASGAERGVYSCLRESLNEVLARLDQKEKWRRADKVPLGSPPERRVKIKTNIQRHAGQHGGLDESADPAAPFVLHENDPRPKGLKAGAYWLNSGQYGYYSETVDQGLRGGPKATKRFRIVYLHETPDGKLVRQKGGYAAPNSSWGWDGRFEMQPNGKGGWNLMVTQGAMELPGNLRGAKPGAKDLPEISKHNYARSRHIFEPVKFEGDALYVIDKGSILEMKPSTVAKEWVSADPAGNLLHAHGYGENFIPDPKDPRKMWLDEFGYPVRIFDMVTEQTTMRLHDGSLEAIPSRTQSIAVRMDPKNPSKLVAKGTKLPNGKPADEFIVVMSEELPHSPGRPAESAIRMDVTLGSKDTAGGIPVERRVVNADRTVTITQNPPGKPPTLVEGFNPVPGVVELPSGRKYWLSTFSASEYTAGAKVPAGQKKWRYGSYLGFRPAEQGPLGRYQPVTEMTKKGEDFADVLEDFTEHYGLSWGTGRPQIYQDGQGRWWMDAHAVDTDLLPAGHPKSGYPPNAKAFADDYRRHKISIPIKWTEKNGQPWLEIDDVEVAKEITEYRKTKAAARP